MLLKKFFNKDAQKGEKGIDKSTGISVEELNLKIGTAMSGLWNGICSIYSRTFFSVEPAVKKNKE